MSISKLATVLAAALTFGLGAIAGRVVRSAPESAADGAPLSDGKRYKVPVSMSQPTRGAKAALVTVVEWCDLRGRACSDLDLTMERVLAEFPGKVRHVWRHLPGEASEDSRLAHEFARIAHENAGKFWEARALLLSRAEPLHESDLAELAVSLGMEGKVVSTAMAEHSHAGYVAADGLFASKFAVHQAPTLFVNGRRLLGQPTRERLVRLVREELPVAEALVARGVSLEKVYDELTGSGLWDAPSSPLAKRL